MKEESRSVSKFTNGEKSLIKSTVATLSIKRIPDDEIIKEVFNQTKTITTRTLWNVRQQIKKESYHWYHKLREGEYEYIHEFKERINEIMWLQKKHQEIIDKNPISKMDFILIGIYTHKKMSFFLKLILEKDLLKELLQKL